jgi:hypothetical protein
MGLVFELKASCLLGRYSTAGATLPALIAMVILKIGSCLLELSLEDGKVGSDGEKHYKVVGGYRLRCIFRIPVTTGWEASAFSLGGAPNPILSSQVRYTYASFTLLCIYYSSLALPVFRGETTLSPPVSQHTNIDRLNFQILGFFW